MNITKQYGYLVINGKYYETDSKDGQVFFKRVTKKEVVSREKKAVKIAQELKGRLDGEKVLMEVLMVNLTKKELNRIAVVAPHATVAVIKGFEVAQKFQVEVPDEFVNVVKCFNPNCITRHQQITTRFHTISKKPLKLKCHHCERSMDQERISLL